MTSWVKRLNPNWYTYPSLRSVQALQFVLSLLIPQVAFDASSFSSGTYPVVHRTRWPDFFSHISFSAFHDFVTAGLQDRWSQKFGGRGGRTPLRTRVSTHPHTPKIRGRGGRTSLRIRVSAYPLTNKLKKFGGRGGRTPLRIRVSTHPHTPKIRGEGWSNSTAYPPFSRGVSKSAGYSVVTPRPVQHDLETVLLIYCFRCFKTWVSNAWRCRCVTLTPWAVAFTAGRVTSGAVGAWGRTSDEAYQ